MLKGEIVATERVCIVGNFGSGKSHFAKIISEEYGLPIIHLDTFYWHPDWTRCTRAEFLAHYDEILAEEKWILDGSYPEFNLRRRFNAADLVFFLDMPFKFCLKQMLNRRSETRDDFPADEHKTKISRVLELVFLFRQSLFGIIDRPMIMNAAKHSTTPFIRIQDWSDEDVALELCKS